MHKAALLRLTTVGFLAVGAFSMNLALAQAESQDFYQPPTTLPAGEGTMIKSEPTPLLGQIPGIPGTWPGNGEKIMYTSTLVDGTPVATTGAAITPAFPGAGPVNDLPWSSLRVRSARAINAPVRRTLRGPSIFRSALS